MIDGIPLIVDPVYLKDFALGAMTALALRRGRIDRVLNRFLPGDE